MINKKELIKILKSKKLDSYSEEIYDNLSIAVEKTLKDKMKEIRNKKRIIANDNTKDHMPATEVFSAKEIETFPSWVRDDIKNTQIVGKTFKVLQTSNGRKYHRDNKLNHLSGAEWTFFINSVINTRYPTSGDESFAHHIRKAHPSPKPPQLMEEIIKFFTNNFL